MAASRGSPATNVAPRMSPRAVRQLLDSWGAPRFVKTYYSKVYLDGSNWFHRFKEGDFPAAYVDHAGFLPFATLEEYRANDRKVGGVFTFGNETVISPRTGKPKDGVGVPQSIRSHASYRRCVGDDGRVISAEQRSIALVVRTVNRTVAAARGQQVQRTMKVKENRFTSDAELERYVQSLLVAQSRKCALTGIPLQIEGQHDDDALLLSLDRIDSDGHYEPGNLQLVCRFVNFWKSDADDAEFRRLIKLVRGT